MLYVCFLTCCHAFLYWTAHITINRIAVPIKCISAVGWTRTSLALGNFAHPPLILQGVKKAKFGLLTLLVFVPPSFRSGATYRYRSPKYRVWCCNDGASYSKKNLKIHTETPLPLLFLLSPPSAFPSLSLSFSSTVCIPQVSLRNSLGPLYSGERCKLPQRGLGQSPSRNRFCWHLVATILMISWESTAQISSPVRTTVP